MLLDELYAYYKSWTALTRDLKFGFNTYQGWRKKGYIPYATQLLIEKKTNGRFKANERHAKPQSDS
ncbi:hypothetical protein [Legionella micdadei]|uniref:Uncharacterized protein n=1 Tax=Legionella micdadei TaxID=451 RepID=A0A098GG84_LEGMI|nr:hypothetical protein [Legionella micdadei]KTD28410.1 hypothetical protein Lmic_1521 [Legionella micdadei]CEG60997.1 protein of unknown function [Legionella micdadei]SCY70189.1 hypothetical protein SAMN02982997_02565 [Legionella micdadei]